MGTAGERMSVGCSCWAFLAHGATTHALAGIVEPGVIRHRRYARAIFEWQGGDWLRGPDVIRNARSID
jgi:hypothetical protein